MTDPMIAAVAAQAAQTPQLIAAYVFGSVARGERDPRDLDVALLWDAEATDPHRWKAGEEFATRLEIAVGKTVDLVDLRKAPPALQLPILREGVRVLDRDPVARIRFQAMTVSMAIDFLEWQRPYIDRWLERVADGG